MKHNSYNLLHKTFALGLDKVAIYFSTGEQERCLNDSNSELHLA
jgi:hypothetical protein